jgi:hypothetical protein
MEDPMDNYSFWKLINKHRINIPIIQRDYAQGRKTPVNSERRRDFVQTIVAALTTSKKPLHLNFIYGKIHGLKDQQKLTQNKNAIETMLKAVGGYSKSLNLSFNYTINEATPPEPQLHQTSFIPLDGQQRLTTLFLIHWYLLRRINNATLGNLLKTLLNFSYHIRPSTKDFCRELVSNNIVLEAGKLLSEQVIDTPWFFLYWQKDPTVKGMLTMLDEIHSQCGEKNAETINSMWEKLIAENSSISFDLLDLDELELTDELYVKMNARGKALTAFENFKAWLMQYVVENNIQVEIKDWPHKIDTDWSDLFWDNQDDENMIIDEEYMRYFRNMMQIFYVINNSMDSKTDDGKKARAIAINNVAPRGYVFVSNSQIAEWGILTKDNLNEMFSMLDIISSNKENKLVKSAFKDFVTGDITFPKKVLFYGMACYLQKEGKSLNIDNLSAFNAVLKKLIDNQEIDDVAIIKTICNGFRTNAVNFEPLYTNLAEEKVDFPGFRPEQVREERIKAALFLKNDKDWSDRISEAEKHPYFNGQVGFLLHLSKISIYYEEHKNVAWPTDKDTEMKDAFAKFSSIARNDIFSENGIRTDNGNLVERALLTYGNPGDLLYSEGASQKKSFPKDKDRDYSWNRYLRGYSAMDKPLTVWEILESLFDDIKGGKSCDDIVKSASPTVNDWRKCFINFPETIKFCGSNKWFLDTWDGKFLLTKSNRRSDYRELETFFLYKEYLEGNAKQFSPFTKAQYWIGNSNNEEACAYLDDFKLDDYCIRLDVFYKKQYNHWSLELSAVEKSILESQRLPEKLKLAGMEFTANEEKKRLCYIMPNDSAINHVQQVNHVQEIILKICQVLQGIKVSSHA